MQIGIQRQLDAHAGRTLAAMLRWTQAGDGVAASVVVRSPRAVATRVALNFASIPDGLEVRFFSLEEDVVYGPFRRGEVLASAAGYWSPVIEGSSVGIEFYLPTPMAREAFSFTIPEVSHLLASVKRGFKHLFDIGNSDFCEIDVKCNPAWDLLSKAVAKMIFTVPGVGSFLCTGTLMNDAVPTTVVPYFLTAHHCVEDQPTASTINFYWFFERSTCGGANPTSVTQTTGGGTLLATERNLDFTFLRLNNAPPSGVTLSGWSAGATSAGEPVTGIHHPAGDLKKISAGGVLGFDSWHGIVPNTHIVMSWTSGVTEGGSSGSGLFRGSTWPNQFLIGFLTGGSSFCTAPNDPDAYGRFDLTYPSISSFLNPATPPSTPVPISPIGIITATQPSFTWGASNGATLYYLWVDDSDGNKVKTFYTPAAAGCPSGTGNCTISPGVTLNGSGTWWIAALNGAGQSPWSGGTNFTILPALTLSASIRALAPVTSAPTGGTAKLWASVLNNGGLTFSAGAKVWFFVDGPGWTGDHWVGSANVDGLTPGNHNWYSFDWAVPSSATPGSYTFWARVFSAGPISPWSTGQLFTVTGPPKPSTTAPILFPVNGGSVAPGANAVLWARVTNNGPITLPAGAKVWFYVDGPGWTGDHWVGATMVDGLASGATQWYSFNWPVPMAATGTHTYWAQVWASGAISPWSTGMMFSITP